MHCLIKANGHYDFHNHVLYNISSLWYAKTTFSFNENTVLYRIWDNALFYESNLYSHIIEPLVLKITQCMSLLISPNFLIKELSLHCK